MIIKTKEPMKNHTTFKIGGEADCYCIPETKEELKELYKFLNNERYYTYIIGKGSNILVSDSGISGCVIDLGNNLFNDIVISDTYVTVGACVSLWELIEKLKNASLGGMEALCGIPGLVGGAICMNAGAYKTEMSDLVEEVYVIDSEGTERVLSKDDCQFSYRDSIFQKEKYIIIGAKLKLQEKNKADIEKEINQYKENRKQKQPLDKCSAGSFFKRPKDYFAGQLIEESRLKGYSVGDAQVSEKHCGFIVNNGNAKAKDVMNLAKHIQETVSTYHGVDLEIEVKLWGKF